MYLRVCKTFLVAMVAFFAFLVALNNIVDYGSNFSFVEHVLLMDTTFEGNALMGRSIDSPAIHHFLYWIIIATEGAVAVLCGAGVVQMAANLKAGEYEFQCAKFYATCGLVLGVVLWFTGFLTVGGEWFLMWQSESWNGQGAAFKFVVILMAVLLFLHQGETKLKEV